MTNKYKPHLLILPEDDANRALANGFLLGSSIQVRNIQVIKPAGGWCKTLESIESCKLYDYPMRQLLLLIDFDDDIQNRKSIIKSRIDESLKDRIFVLGTASEPERLRIALGKSFEEIGLQVANECSENNSFLWENTLLEHNKEEVQRLCKAMREILIQNS